MKTLIPLPRAVPKILTAIVLVLLGLIFLAPFAVMISTSFKTMKEAFDPTGTLVPRSLNLENYPIALGKIPFFEYSFNTALITFWTLVGQLVVTPMVAYSLAKIKWKGSGIIFTLVLATMMIPYTVTMIPLYRTWSLLGLTSTYLPLIVPAFTGHAFFIIIMRQFFLGIPNSLMEAARIDGCSEVKTYVYIALPLMKPALSTVAIFTFLATWSDYLAPMIYISKPERFTLSLGLQAFLNQYTIDWTLLMAAATIFVLPVIVVFLILQRYFVEGISISGLK